MYHAHFIKGCDIARDQMSAFEGMAASEQEVEIELAPPPAQRQLPAHAPAPSFRVPEVEVEVAAPPPSQSRRQLPAHAPAPTFSVPEDEQHTPGAIRAEVFTWMSSDSTGEYHLRKSKEATREFAKRVTDVLTLWNRKHPEDTEDINFLNRTLTRIKALMNES